MSTEPHVGADSDGTVADYSASESERFWEGHYRGYRGPWAARANPLLVETVAPLAPGTALDLGCGLGGDTIWLARRGWRVTAVDISSTAVDQVRRQALELGLGDRVVAEQHDVATGFPSGEFDLISAQYFHTPFALPRGQVLRTSAHALRPGGLLLLVDHGSIAPWSWNQDRDTHFPTPDEVFAEMDLDRRQWSPVRTDMPRREATGPNGETAVVVDNVLLVRRAGR
ncbi:class I SAM-dependent methyltransferase [Pseudonocardia sp. DSM 110487]|uniref:SAM-dependent methyltransferase n=1 Tax=Pseudonocardia sp. DSM 110487 TaxID=2865833 RepID=UPI001C6A38AB|nr:class I SAM-dependent methyltransferase [Pseudonocardia sp. DSM 110487]QYN38706.1 class I SAM-dependent methyltransferase [Pseudonocardia sp. DSM 110487]